MSNPQVLELRRQIDETERRIARLGEPASRDQLLLLFSLERDLKERRRRLARLRHEEAVGEGPPPPATTPPAT